MGGAVSAGENNDELIDNLVEANYIRSKHIENIFRAVDRGNYYLEDHRDTAYHDLAWKFDHLHISAPCIYSEVMGSLQLKGGLSFLNIGSGTGYLSTMAGLMLGVNGINHGIEIHGDVVDYAMDKVHEFMLQSHAFDRFTFCEPEFVIGNCLNLSPDTPGYDRIYCGAACPAEYESFIKNLLNVGGILVMPLNDQLQVIQRTGQTNWESKNVLAVNFASLVVPSDGDNQPSPKMPDRSPSSLQALCRVCIRCTLSAKFHSGSNRIHKKRTKTVFSDDEDLPNGGHTGITSSSSSSSENNEENASSASEALSESDNELGSGKKDDSNTTGKKICSLLDVSSGTVIAVESSSSSSSSSSGSSSSNAPLKKSLRASSTATSQTTPPPGTDAESMDVEPPPSADDGDDKAKHGLPRKKRKGKPEREASSPSPRKNGSNGKKRRSRRGCYPFFRRHRKSRKAESKGKELVQYEERASDNVGSENENKTSAAEPSTRQGETRRTTSVNIHVSSDSTTLRSFLMGMSVGMNSVRDPSHQMTQGDRLLSFLAERALQRQNIIPTAYRGGRDCVGNSDRSFECEENHSHGLFRDAIMQLPVPHAIKRYLLFYRE